MATCLAKGKPPGKEDITKAEGSDGWTADTTVKTD
jgi:hypothetical protein